MVTPACLQARWRLLESMRWEPAAGYFLLDRHLCRLAASAAHFGWNVDLASVRRALEHHGSELTDPTKVRLLVGVSGGFEILNEPISTSYELQVSISARPVDERDEFLRHKTTRRDSYDSCFASAKPSDDVVLWNRRGEITETCFGNVVCRIENVWMTPPLHCGLLAGTLRAHLLDTGVLCEGVIKLSDLGSADEIYRINSVRGWSRMHLTKSDSVAARTDRDSHERREN